MPAPVLVNAPRAADRVGVVLGSGADADLRIDARHEVHAGRGRAAVVSVGTQSRATHAGGDAASGDTAVEDRERAALPDEDRSAQRAAAVAAIILLSAIAGTEAAGARR